MQYGLYLSATGVITSSYRQDVIANNIANSETTGFKRDLATFAQRPTADQTNPMKAGFSSKLLDKIGGGTFASPTYIDSSEGTIEPTNSDLDAAIEGNGYFTVTGRSGKVELTRDGQFRIDKTGRLILNGADANPVLDPIGHEIKVDPTIPTKFDTAGHVLQNNISMGQLAVVSVEDPAKLSKAGGNLYSYSDPYGLKASDAAVRGGFLERSNVDPATELTALMDAQRVLEANANMMHYQDQMLGDLVNTVGKIS